MNYQFDCQNMPADVKALFFDSYRKPNNTVVTVYVAEERELLRNWLLANGANLEDEVTVLHKWDETEVSEKFTIDGESDDDDDDDDEEEVKPKKQRKIRVESDDIPDYSKICSGTPDIINGSIDTEFLIDEETE